VGTTPVGAAAVDGAGLTAGCGFTVTVDDVEAPRLGVTLVPDRLWPPNHRMMDITATLTASDNCGPVAIYLDGLASNEADDDAGDGDGSTVDDIQGEAIGSADSHFRLRAERDAGGEGRFYTAAYSALDEAGNVSPVHPTVFVPHDQAGGADPIHLQVTGTPAGTTLRWDPVNGALYYTVIRGSVAGLREETQFINLGSVTCLDAAAAAPDAAEREDPEIPPVGAAFFYAVAYHDQFSSSYGTVSAAKPRVVANGDCP
jgi:hypothetical protein